MRMILKCGAFSLILATACTTVTSGSPDGADGSVVVAAWPVAELTRELVGDQRQIIDLTPAGAEPHDLELTAADLEAVLQADAIVYIGGGFQPSLQDAIPDSVGIDLLELSGSQDLEDPHVWLDPSLWAAAATQAAEVLSEALEDPSILVRGKALSEDLLVLDAAMEAGLASCERDLFITEHEAFGALAARYGLTEESLTGLSPEAEVRAETLISLSELIEREGVTTVFAEPGGTGRLAASLADATDVSVEELDPMERSGLEGDYFSRMRANLDALRKALGCG